LDCHSSTQEVVPQSILTLAEQLDYIYHNGVEAWKTDIIDPIKARYPKP
jgi:hypothetical protein